MTQPISNITVANEDELNRDPLSGAPGSHPLGTGAGAASGGLTGAAVGMAIGGPVGSVICAAVGAVAGGLSGKSAAEVLNPTAEEEYWRAAHVNEPYYMNGNDYDFYAPGFRAGWEGRVRYEGRSFDDAEAELAENYNRSRIDGGATWQELSAAANAAWNRVDKQRKPPQ